MVLRLRKEKHKLQLEDAGKESLRQKIAELETVIAGGNSSVTAKSICRRVTDHVLEETVNIMFASDSKSGMITWTALSLTERTPIAGGKRLRRSVH